MLNTVRRTALGIAKCTGAAAILLLLASPASAQSGTCVQTGNETVQTDRADYQPGETVLITGSGYAPNCDVVVRVTRPDRIVVLGDGPFTSGSDTVITDAGGNFGYLYPLDGILGIYGVHVLGQGHEPLAYSGFVAGATGYRAPNVTHLPNGWTNRDGAKTLGGATSASTATANAEQGYANFQNNSAGTFVGTLESAIPTGEVPTGIEVQVRARVATPGGGTCTVASHQIDVALSWNNGTTYTAFMSQHPLTASFATYTLGGPANLWGRTWSASEFSNANFVAKVRYTRLAGCSGGSIALDLIQVQVSHAAAGACAGQANGFECRASVGDCDAAETCDGVSNDCPADGFEPDTTLCTGASQGGACDDDAADHCSGTDNSCVDVFQADTVECRADAGACDVAAENCTGTSGACPADTFEPDTTLCTGASQSGACDDDAADHCSGTDTSCVDVFQASTFECRADAGQCDVAAENCTGTSGACPADTFEPDTTLCTGASQGGACDDDAADHCSGTDNSCVDEFKANTVECRADAGACDVVENCSGSSGACPADDFEPDTTACGDQTDNACDNPNRCSGTDNTCLDKFEPDTTACGDPDTTACNAADTCDGAGTCADRKKAAGTFCSACIDDPPDFECPPVDATCDPEDTCDGINNTCAPVFAVAGTACGDPDATACNAADTCNGAGACEDRKDAAGTVCLAGTGTCDPNDTCNGTTNACAPVLAGAGTSCSDGNACTAPDQCDGVGACAGGALTDAGAFVGPLGTNTRATVGNSSITLTTTTAVAAGNSIIITLQAGSFAGTIGCSDPTNGAYTTDIVSPAGSGRIAIISKINSLALASGSVITCTYPGFAGTSNVAAYQFSGLGGLDKVRGTGASSNAGSATSGLTPATTQANELVFGFVNLGNGASQTFTPATSGGSPAETPYDPLYTPLTAIGGLRPMYRFVNNGPRQYEANGTVTGAGGWKAQVATYTTSCVP